MKLRIALICFMIITTLSLSSACEKTKKTETKFKIDFGTVDGDHWDISNVKLYYNADALGKKVPEKRGVVYMAFKTVNYEAIAEQFGFDVAHLYPSVDDTVEYYDESDLLKRRLLIRPNGIICYETGVAQTAFESKVSKDDCVELTKKVLKEYKLTDHSFDDECFFSERVLTDPSNNETKTVGYTVFLYFLLNGVKLYGEPRATVQFNGNGEVVSIMYNMPDYYEAGECELINIRQALKSIEKGNIPMMYGLEEAPEKVTIEDVELCYYSQTFDVNTVVAQPVYVFSATGHYKEENRQFRIVVQAN